MGYSLAIEIGGVNTSIYRKDQGLVLKESSLVCASNVGNQYEIKAIGEEAEKLQGKTNENTYIFSPVICGEVKSIEYCAEMLKYFLQKIELRKFPREKAILCVAAGASEETKDDLRKVCYLAGLGKVKFIPSIICAAYASELPINLSKTVFAIHVGGTITDLACINMNSILKGASIEIGGRYLDIEIAELVAKKYKTSISIVTAKRIKEEVASLVENDIRTIEVVGINESTGKPKQIVVSSEDLRPSLISFMQNIVSAIETTINVCPPEVSADVSQDGIFISGGLSSIAGMEKYLRKKLQLKVTIANENENAVILSAGRILSDKKTLNEIIDNF